MLDCIEKTGRELNLNNEGIVKYLCGIEEERKNLEIIIQRQYQERKRIEAEIEKLTYKLCLINKSLSMRIKAKNNYDKTIEEIKEHYDSLVASSNKLRQVVQKTQEELDAIMNKKTGTSPSSEREDIKILYYNKPKDTFSSSRELDPDDCICKDIPTQEKLKPESPLKITSLTNKVISSSSQEILEIHSNSKNQVNESHTSVSPDIPQTIEENSSQTDQQEKLTNEKSNSSVITPIEKLDIKKDTQQSGSNTHHTWNPSISSSNKFLPPDHPAKKSPSKGKNLFLSKLRTSLSKPKDVEEIRETKLESRAVEKEKHMQVDELPSETNPNQLLKRSMEGLLNHDFY